MHHIQTIIFDLGGVIIDLHIEKTIRAFANLSGANVSEIEQAYLNAGFFTAYEKGLITDDEFREQLRAELNVLASEAAIDEAWNAMLGIIPEDRINAILTLMKKYKCIVLSNTNAIHERKFHEILAASYPYQHLNELFNEVYFSHELMQRKPDAEIYRNVLKRSKTSASEALFLDDSVLNLEEAAKLDIKTLHIPRNSGFNQLLAHKLSNL